MILAALWIIFYGGYYDCIIVDQVSVCVPYLRFFRRKVLFYCHFPDKLLCVERTSIFKKIYRFFLDLFEEITLLSANLILVNSNFTQQIFYANFPILKKMKKPTEVLYPSIDLKKFDDLLKNPLSKKSDFTLNEKFFLSLNRYERKKNIGLAIKAFAIMKKTKLNNQSIKIKLI